METTASGWGLMRRRQCLAPTFRGCLVLALGAAFLVFIVIGQIHPFLALNRPAPGGVLVVEGWLPDYALEAAIAEFKRHHYATLCVTGIPLEEGAPLSEYKNYADLGSAILVKLGMSTNDVQAVPAPHTQRDRTYAMALSLKAWLRHNPRAPTQVNLISQGPHARRSRLMFEKALGRGFTVGVIAVPAKSYDERHWWRSSQGVRMVIDEAIAYVYARFLFHPPKDDG